jgi:hypothetical protein
VAADLDLKEDDVSPPPALAGHLPRAGGGMSGRSGVLPLSLRRARALGGGLVVLGLFVIVLGLTGWAAVPLLGTAAAGMGMTYLSRLDLTLEERLAFGTVIGALALAMADLLLALVFGLGLPVVLAGLGATLAASAPGWWRGRRLLSGELDDAVRRWTRREPWPLWVLLLVAWPFTLVLLGRAYQYTSEALVAGNIGVYADWAAHLTYAGSFAYGQNFPPQFPVDPGHRLAYPFLIDLLAASFVPLGTSLTSALVLSSGLLALAFPAVMYLAGRRLTGSRLAAALAVGVFSLSGGLGFLTLVGGVRGSALGRLLPQGSLLTQDTDRNYQWLNPVLAWLVPQRSVLFGFSLALLVMAILWIAASRREAGWAPFTFAGLVTGLAPLAHLHAYGTIVALAAFWALLDRRPQWLGFFAPALALGLPAVLWMLGGGAAAVKVQVWWLASSDGHSDGPLWFWLKNTGLLVPAMAAAFAWRGILPGRLALLLAPVWLWFLVPNFLVFQPWDWDNTKFFAYWLLFGSLAVGALLASLISRRLLTALAGCVLAITLMVSGFADVARTLDPAFASAAFTDTGGVQVATWARTNTDPRAIFLVAPVHNDPIPTLAGRRVVVGYPGWLWTYGLSDWNHRADDAQRMLRGDPATPGLLRQYRVSYVVLGPEDQSFGGANRAYFDQFADRVYERGGYTVYRVRGA